MPKSWQENLRILSKGECLLLDGRLYLGYTHFDIDLADGWTLASSEEFKGTSHEKITMEVYERCDVQHG